MRGEELRALAEAATYLADAEGGIWSASGWRGQPLRRLVPETHDGYQRVRLTISGRRVNRMVHALVAEAFLGARPPGTQVCHSNGDRQDNRATNLRWGTAAVNAADRDEHGTTARGVRNGAARLTDSKVVGIRFRASRGESQRSIARALGVSQRTVGHVIRGERWTHV